MELNGYYFRNLLKKTRRRFALAAGEQALYQELVDICNEENWRTSFQVSNGELTNALNCNEKTLIGWRQSLINAGLIKYSSGQSKRSFGNYTLAVEKAVNITVNSATNPGTNVTTNPGTNPADYKNKPIKSKLKETVNTGDLPPLVSIEIPETFKPVWQKWKDYKLSQFKKWYKTEDSEQTAFNKLQKISGGNQETALEIINESISNIWNGFFELKNKKNGTTTDSKSTQRTEQYDQLNDIYAQVATATSGNG